MGGMGASAILSRRGAESCTCSAHAGRTCPSCVQRRRYAWSLVTERGETFEAAAWIMKLEPGRVRELVAEETDRRELAEPAVRLDPRATDAVGDRRRAGA